MRKTTIKIDDETMVYQTRSNKKGLTVTILNNGEQEDKFLLDDVKETEIHTWLKELKKDLEN